MLRRILSTKYEVIGTKSSERSAPKETRSSNQPLAREGNKNEQADIIAKSDGKTSPSRADLADGPWDACALLAARGDLGGLCEFLAGRSPGDAYSRQSLERIGQGDVRRGDEDGRARNARPKKCFLSALAFGRRLRCQRNPLAIWSSVLRQYAHHVSGQVVSQADPAEFDGR